MNDTVFVLVNRQTGALIGLTQSWTDTQLIESLPLDPECVYFLEALQAYTPKHVFTAEDIEIYYNVCTTREAFGWDLLPKNTTQLSNNILTSKLKFDTYYPAD